MLTRLVAFLRESKIELKKVMWPTRQETIRLTFVVVLVSGAMAMFLGGLDFVFQWALNTFIL